MNRAGLIGQRITRETIAHFEIQREWRIASAAQRIAHEAPASDADRGAGEKRQQSERELRMRRPYSEREAHSDEA